MFVFIIKSLAHHHHHYHYQRQPLSAAAAVTAAVIRCHGRPAAVAAVLNRQWQPLSSLSFSFSSQTSFSHYCTSTINNNNNNNNNENNKATTTTTSATVTTGASFVISPQVLSPPTTKSPPKPSEGWLVDLFERFSLVNSYRQKQLAEELYQAILYQASDPIWFGPGRVPRAFRNRHAMITMHLWFLHKRLISDKYDEYFALCVQQDLFDVFWDDTINRIRAEGTIPELMVNKSLQKVQQYTMTHLVHYDECYSPEHLTKPMQRHKHLKRLIARHILLSEQDLQEYSTSSSNKNNQTQSSSSSSQKQQDEDEADEEPFADDVTSRLVRSKLDSQMDRLAYYIDAQYQNICVDWPHEYYYKEGRVAWIAPPDFSNLKKDTNQQGITTILPDVPLHPDDVVPYPWMRNTTIKGKTYYWNMETDESTWEKPTATSPPPTTATMAGGSSLASK